MSYVSILLTVPSAFVDLITILCFETDFDAIACCCGE
jgi:hypothetical protein